MLNLVALTPLLERFEAESGTLVSLLLFFGRKGSIDYHRGVVLTYGLSILHIAWHHIRSDRAHHTTRDDASHGREVRTHSRGYRLHS